MHKNGKVKELGELAGVLGEIRNQKGHHRVVQCHGVFDLLHIGHIRHFQQAKTAGDLLVVTITPDNFVHKGPHRPAFTEQLRAESIAALDCVDYVAINRWPTAVEAIKLLKPDVYAKGPDYKDPTQDRTGKISEEEEAVASVGGRLLITEDIAFSSSNLLNRHLPSFSPEVTQYLADFSSRYGASQVIGYLENARSLKVLVVGETIVDEYQYCEQLGKSTKEPILATRYVTTEKYPGGIAAVANHVANFCDNVTMLSLLGDRDSQEDFVRGSLHHNVNPVFLYKAGSPTIVKRRYVESYLLQKLFEVYEINDENLNRDQDEEMCHWLNNNVSRYDVVIVVDYGHGMITPAAVRSLCEGAKFLAVNTQSNAGNRGLNTISKYSRADYVCLAHHEIALEERSRHMELRDMMRNVSMKLNCGNIVVTRGRDGNTCYSRGEGFVDVPAFAHRVVDRVGAGDAVISTTALCVAQNAPMEIVGFIGNTVGAEAVATVGNKNSIDKVGLARHIESLLK